MVLGGNVFVHQAGLINRKVQAKGTNLEALQTNFDDIVWETA